MRIGMGYDVHRLVEGRDLILCGVKIPFEKGLLGHSDADVAVHAIMDALLGAAALGDIGQHFPDTAPRYKGISSIRLLERVGKLLEKNFYFIGNIDATIIAQRPKLAPYRAEMVKNVARALEISEDQVCIKATTEEGLGFTGQGEGISAQAIALLNQAADYYEISGKMCQRHTLAGSYLVAEGGEPADAETAQERCAECTGCKKLEEHGGSCQGAYAAYKEE